MVFYVRDDATKRYSILYEKYKNKILLSTIRIHIYPERNMYGKMFIELESWLSLVCEYLANIMPKSTKLNVRRFRILLAKFSSKFLCWYKSSIRCEVVVSRLTISGPRTYHHF